jgi:predicted nuclease of predicted toxin-antitoxin system
MQLLADENIQQPTVRFLQDRGWDIQWIPDEGLSGAADSNVFGHAQKSRRTILAYDADFVDVRALDATRHSGIIRLRFSNQRQDFVCPHLLAALEQLRHEDLRDTLVTITDERIRLRKTGTSQGGLCPQPNSV